MQFNSNTQVQCNKYNNTNKTNNYNNKHNKYNIYRQTDTVDSYLIVIYCTMYINNEQKMRNSVSPSIMKKMKN